MDMSLSSGSSRMGMFAALLLSTVARSYSASPPPEPVGKELVYKTVGERALHLYVTSPEDGKPAHSAIVFFHGGAWTMGQVSQFNVQAQYFASRGMVAVQVEYRLVAADSHVAPEVCAQDAKSAMRWVRGHAKELHIDPNRIVGAGGSAGGYLAAFTAVVPGWDDPNDDLAISPKPNALMLFFPVLDISTEGFGYKRFGEQGSVKYAPETYLGKDTPPTIIFAGAADKLVSPESLRKYKALAEKADSTCDLVFYDDQPHGFANKEPYQSITMKAGADFLGALGYIAKESARF